MTTSPLDALTDAIRELEAHYAYDQGAADSGVRDLTRRKELAAVIDAAPQEERRWALSRFIALAFLSEKAYGWEEARSFVRWFEMGDYR